ncbi:hypothetical protein CFC21_090414 [Triticum aestivum]|uniref:F-box domain-containing protein n=2 Tax=Triticum aestivum TaxID=4565 RepID=A0A9R1MRW1_WHEAT|nr:uncharacterized protein LOC123135201 [Triticum aestivum]KAF7087209.1 hypothetical protein CFC21_090414 [Triticum aestivum]
MSSSLRRPAAARPISKPSAKGLNSHNRWSSLANLIPEEEESYYQDDRLSNLPDDVLLNIVERLDIADAARTSTLSRRWKPIPSMLPEISIKVGSVDPEHDRTCNEVVRANATILGATRSLLENRTANLHAIRCMRFFLGDASTTVGQTVRNTIATKKVGLAEFDILTEKVTNRCTDDDMVTYGRQLMAFVDACPDTFSGLTRLKLENVMLGGSDFPKIFSICKRLVFLRLDNCDMGLMSLLELQHPQLRELEMENIQFERVDLNCLPELTTLTFSWWASPRDPLSFGYVPLLQTVSIANTTLSYHKMLKLSEVLGNATISNLHLNFESEKIWVKPEGPKELSQVFNKLRLVHLADISKDCDLTWTMFVLQGAPSLEELRITVRDRCLLIRDKTERKLQRYSEEKKDAGTEWETSASDFKHHNLSVLRIIGFQSQDKFVDYVTAVMEAAVNLKDIYLLEKPMCDTCTRMKIKDRYPRTTKRRNLIRSYFNMDMHPLLRIHFPVRTK